MTEQEKYLFDLQGYIAVPNAISPEHLAELNAGLEAHWAEGDAAPNQKYFHFRGLLRWGKAFWDMLDNPRITPYLDELLGPGYRLDHEYIVAIRKDGGGPGLHGVAGGPYDQGQYYHWHNGRMYNGLLVVSYNLRDVPEGKGGFACIPGSHKANYPLPKGWGDLNPAQPIVKAVTGPAGQCVIFTEALWHGTMPWTADHERRTLFYKYCPSVLGWYNDQWDADELPGLSEKQRQILLPPNARLKNTSYMKAGKK